MIVMHQNEPYSAKQALHLQDQKSIIKMELNLEVLYHFNHSNSL